MNLLLNKLSIPIAPTDKYVKPSDLQLVKEQQGFPTTVLSAPAGYGKSLLANSFCLHWPGKATWYSLNDTDNSPATFLAYLAKGLSNVIPLPSDVLADALAGRVIDALAFTENLISFVEQQTSAPILLVLDDFHCINDEVVKQLVALLVRQSGCGYHLVITTRNPVPPDYARQRLAGKLLEITADELKFSLQDAQQFLFTGQASELTEKLPNLVQSMEGWPAGLQLLKLISRRSNELPEILEKHESQIFDYLYYEVFRNLSDSEQTFLLQMSTVNSFNAGLATHIFGEAASTVIAKLVDLNAFIIPMGSGDTWYRFHHLLHAFLRQKLAATYPSDKINTYHSSACEWFLENKLVESATEHAIQSKNCSLLLNVLQAHGWELYNRGYVSLQKQCFDLLGNELICSDVNVALQCVWFNKVIIRDNASALRLIALVKQQLASTMDKAEWAGYEKGVFNLIKAHIAEEEDDTATAFHAVEEAYEHFTDTECYQRALVYSVHALAELKVGNLSRAYELSRHADAIDTRENQPAGVIWHRHVQARIKFEMGEMLDASKLITEALELIDHEKISYMPKLDYICGVQSFVSYELSQFENAERFAKKAAEHATNWPASKLPPLNILLAISLVKNDSAAAESYFKEIESIFLSERIYDDFAAEVATTLCCYFYGTKTTPPNWFIDLVYRPIGSQLWTCSRQRLARATYALLHSPEKDSLKEIESLINCVEKSEFKTILVRAYVLKAVALAAHAPESAMQALEQAIKHITSSNSFTPFIEYSAYLAPLLTQLKTDDVTINQIAQRILSYSTTRKNDIRSQKPKKQLPEAVKTAGLSYKEWETLKQLDANSSNDINAEKMHISVNTLKKHLKNIYKKLGVSNRSEALDAREKLLEEIDKLQLIS